MNINAPIFTAAQSHVLIAARRLGRTCGYEASHASQVTRLALRLFQELAPVHHLDGAARYYLVCAGILHDVGWVEGGKNHHKTGLDIILNSSLLPINSRERLIIGSVVRYHFGALPDLKHDHFAALQPEDQQIVCSLAALLRLADGLDQPHHLQVRDLKCDISEEEIQLWYLAPARARAEEKAAKAKSDLLKQVYQRHFSIHWLSPTK